MYFNIFLIALLNSAVLSTSGPMADFCGTQTSAECLAKVRRMAAETNRFWFGDQWRFNCQQPQQIQRRLHRTTNSLGCLNPEDLVPFASLGSRLFRVNTFTPAYLANLRIVPRMRFQPRSGSYRACNHQFEVTVPKEQDLFGLVGHPLADPVPSFQAQYLPELSWPELHANQSLVVLLLDVGWGRLNWLAVDFPRDTTTLLEYQSIDNFRPHQPTPMAILVFEPPKKEANFILEGLRSKLAIVGQRKEDEEQKQREKFNLGQFMLENKLEEGLIGLNWVLIEADPFGIERQRLRGMPDNCHSLVLDKLQEDHSNWNFVNSFPLQLELNSFLSVSLVQPQQSSLRVCCLSFSIAEEQFYLDPLADLQIPSSAFRHGLPFVTAMRPMESTDESNAAGYQRASRHYIVLRDDHFSLVLLDPDRHYLHWFLTDISADELASGTFKEAQPVAPFLAPIPASPGKCQFAVFMLFLQPKGSHLVEFFNADHPLRQRHCLGHCVHRTEFDIEQFKALHRLQLSAVNWARVCFDRQEAAYQISLIRKLPEELEDRENERTRTTKLGGGWSAKSGRKWTEKRQQHYSIMTKVERDRNIQAICAVASQFLNLSSLATGVCDDDQQLLSNSSSSLSSSSILQFFFSAIFFSLGRWIILHFR